MEKYRMKVRKHQNNNWLSTDLLIFSIQMFNYILEGMAKPTFDNWKSKTKKISRILYLITALTVLKLEGKCSIFFVKFHKMSLRLIDVLVKTKDPGSYPIFRKYKLTELGPEKPIIKSTLAGHEILESNSACVWLGQVLFCCSYTYM